MQLFLPTHILWFQKVANKTNQKKDNLIMNEVEKHVLSQQTDVLEQWNNAFDRKLYDLDLSKAVKTLRKSKNISQVQLANAIGVRQSTISRIEHGQIKTSTAILQNIALATGTNLKITFENK